MKVIQGPRHGRIWLTVLAVGMVTAAAPAYAQAQQAEAPASESEIGARLRQMRDHFGPSVSARIDDVLTAARRKGVPEQILVTKALEGAAKGVPGDRVVSALQSYAGRLERARSLLGGSAGDPLLVAGADALQKGVDPNAVRSVGRASGGDPMPLVVLGDLLDAGVPVGQAVPLVQQALQQGRHGESLLEVPARVRQLMRQGTPPGQAAREVGRSLGAGSGSAGTPGSGPGKARGSGAHGGGPPSGRPHGGPGGG